MARRRSAKNAATTKTETSAGESRRVSRLRVAEHPPGGRGDVGTDAWWGPMVRGERSLGMLNGIAPLQRVHVVREGVPAAALGALALDMGVAREKLYVTLGVPRATMDRKLRQQKRLDPDESERVVGMARLVGQVEQIVRDAGATPDFDAAKWVAAWLDRPLPALGGQRPGTLMSTAEGREIVAGLVAQMQSGAYA